MQLRTTKYDPANRNEQGFYIKDEWISIGDIGRSYDGKIFTASEYFRVEDAYCETVKLLLDAQKIDHLIISNCDSEKRIPNFFTSTKYYVIQNELKGKLCPGRKCNWHEIDLLIRLNLREEFWCVFEGKYGTYLEFGYDYYMLYGSKKNIDLKKLKFPKEMFIEENCPCDGFEDYDKYSSAVARKNK
ncbi:MAG: hypothetical protein Q4G68_01110 [Planctomycetia bacterium]|nr:hypothetical protein [Planctomycetia bacterium]